jgi:hypothetical protein
MEMRSKIIFWSKNNWQTLIAPMLFFGSLAFRLRGFVLFPKFNDEMGEVYWATLIAQGKHFPLVGSNLFSGPVYFYFIALLFKVFGFNYFIPRLVSAVFCALIVPTMYLIGRNLNCKIAGIVSALLFCFFPAFFVINSRLAWSASLTPSFVAFSFLFLVLMYINSQKNSSKYIFGFFTFLAIALQTHPSAIAYGISCGLAFLFYKNLRVYLTRPIFYIGILLFFLLNSTYIYYNIRTGFRSLKTAQMHSYAFETKINATNFLKNIPKALEQEFVSAKGYVMYKSYYKTTEYLSALLTISGLLCCTFFVFGILKFNNFGVGFSLLFLLLSFVILPLVNSSYMDGISFRYFVFTFVACYLILGFGVDVVSNIISAKIHLSPIIVALLLILPIIYCYAKSANNFIDFHQNPVRSGTSTNKRLLKGLGMVKNLVAGGNDIYYPTNVVVGEPSLDGELFLGNSEWQKTQFLFMSDGILINYYNVGDLEKLTRAPDFNKLYYLTIIHSDNTPEFPGLIQEEIYNAVDYKIYKVTKIKQ